MPVARHEFTVMAPHLRQGTEAVQLRLEQEIGMVERLRNAQEPHRGGMHHKVFEPSYQPLAGAAAEMGL